MIGRTPPVPLPGFGLGGESRFRLDRATRPLRERPAPREAQHGCAIETTAQNLQGGLVTRCVPAEVSNTQPHEMHLLPPARFRMRPQPLVEFGRSEHKKFVRQILSRPSRKRLDRFIRGEFLQVVMQERQQHEHRNRAAVRRKRQMIARRWKKHAV